MAMTQDEEEPFPILSVSAMSELQRKRATGAPPLDVSVVGVYCRLDALKASPCGKFLELVCFDALGPCSLYYSLPPTATVTVHNPIPPSGIYGLLVCSAMADPVRFDPFRGLIDHKKLLPSPSIPLDLGEEYWRWLYLRKWLIAMYKQLENIPPTKRCLNTMWNLSAFLEFTEKPPPLQPHPPYKPTKYIPMPERHLEHARAMLLGALPFLSLGEEDGIKKIISTPQQLFAPNALTVRYVTTKNGDHVKRVLFNNLDVTTSVFVLARRVKEVVKVGYFHVDIHLRLHLIAECCKEPEFIADALNIFENFDFAVDHANTLVKTLLGMKMPNVQPNEKVHILDTRTIPVDPPIHAALVRDTLSSHAWYPPTIDSDPAIPITLNVLQHLLTFDRGNNKILLGHKDVTNNLVYTRARLLYKEDIVSPLTGEVQTLSTFSDGTSCYSTTTDLSDPTQPQQPQRLIPDRKNCAPWYDVLSQYVQKADEVCSTQQSRQPTMTLTTAPPGTAFDLFFRLGDGHSTQHTEWAPWDFTTLQRIAPAPQNAEQPPLVQFVSRCKLPNNPHYTAARDFFQENCMSPKNPLNIYDPIFVEPDFLKELTIYYNRTNHNLPSSQRVYDDQADLTGRLVVIVHSTEELGCKDDNKNNKHNNDNNILAPPAPPNLLSPDPYFYEPHREFGLAPPKQPHSVTAQILQQFSDDVKSSILYSQYCLATNGCNEIRLFPGGQSFVTQQEATMPALTTLEWHNTVKMLDVIDNLSPVPTALHEAVPMTFNVLKYHLKRDILAKDVYLLGNMPLEGRKLKTSAHLLRVEGDFAVFHDGTGEFVFDITPIRDLPYLTNQEQPKSTTNNKNVNNKKTTDKNNKNKKVNANNNKNNDNHRKNNTQSSPINTPSHPKCLPPIGSICDLTYHREGLASCPTLTTLLRPTHLPQPPRACTWQLDQVTVQHIAPHNIALDSSEWWSHILKSLEGGEVYYKEHCAPQHSAMGSRRAARLWFDRYLTHVDVFAPWRSPQTARSPHNASIFTAPYRLSPNNLAVLRRVMKEFNELYHNNPPQTPQQKVVAQVEGLMVYYKYYEEFKNNSWQFTQNVHTAHQQVASPFLNIPSLRNQPLSIASRVEEYGMEVLVGEEEKVDKDEQNANAQQVEQKDNNQTNTSPVSQKKFPKFAYSVVATDVDITNRIVTTMESVQKNDPNNANKKSNTNHNINNNTTFRVEHAMVHFDPHLQVVVKTDPLVERTATNIDIPRVLAVQESTGQNFVQKCVALRRDIAFAQPILHSHSPPIPTTLAVLRFGLRRGTLRQNILPNTTLMNRQLVYLGGLVIAGFGMSGRGLFVLAEVIGVTKDPSAPSLSRVQFHDGTCDAVISLNNAPGRIPAVGDIAVLVFRLISDYEGLDFSCAPVFCLSLGRTGQNTQEYSTTLDAQLQYAVHVPTHPIDIISGTIYLLQQFDKLLIAQWYNICKKFYTTFCALPTDDIPGFTTPYDIIPTALMTNIIPIPAPSADLITTPGIYRKVGAHPSHIPLTAPTQTTPALHNVTPPPQHLPRLFLQFDALVWPGNFAPPAEQQQRTFVNPHFPTTDLSFRLFAQPGSDIISIVQPPYNHNNVVGLQAKFTLAHSAPNTLPLGMSSQSPLGSLLIPKKQQPLQLEDTAQPPNPQSPPPLTSSPIHTTVHALHHHGLMEQPTFEGHATFLAPCGGFTRYAVLRGIICRALSSYSLHGTRFPPGDEKDIWVFSDCTGEMVLDDALVDAAGIKKSRTMCSIYLSLRPCVKQPGVTAEKANTNIINEKKESDTTTTRTTPHQSSNQWEYTPSFIVPCELPAEAMEARIIPMILAAKTYSHLTTLFAAHQHYAHQHFTHNPYRVVFLPNAQPPPLEAVHSKRPVPLQIYMWRRSPDDRYRLGTVAFDNQSGQQILSEFLVIPDKWASFFLNINNVFPTPSPNIVSQQECLRFEAYQQSTAHAMYLEFGVEPKKIENNKKNPQQDKMQRNNNKTPQQLQEKKLNALKNKIKEKDALLEKRQALLEQKRCKLNDKILMLQQREKNFEDCQARQGEVVARLEQVEQYLSSFNTSSPHPQKQNNPQQQQKQQKQKQQSTIPPTTTSLKEKNKLYDEYAIKLKQQKKSIHQIREKVAQQQQLLHKQAQQKKHVAILQEQIDKEKQLIFQDKSNYQEKLLGIKQTHVRTMHHFQQQYEQSQQQQQEQQEHQQTTNSHTSCYDDTKYMAKREQYAQRIHDKLQLLVEKKKQRQEHKQQQKDTRKLQKQLRQQEQHRHRPLSPRRFRRLLFKDPALAIQYVLSPPDQKNKQNHKRKKIFIWNAKQLTKIDFIADHLSEKVPHLKEKYDPLFAITTHYRACQDSIKTSAEQFQNFIHHNHHQFTQPTFDSITTYRAHIAQLIYQMLCHCVNCINHMHLNVYPLVGEEMRQMPNYLIYQDVYQKLVVLHQQYPFHSEEQLRQE